MNILHWVYGSANLLIFPQIIVSAQFNILIRSTLHSLSTLYVSFLNAHTPLHTCPSYVFFSLWSILPNTLHLVNHRKIIIANIKKNIFREFSQRLQVKFTGVVVWLFLLVLSYVRGVRTMISSQRNKMDHSSSDVLHLVCAYDEWHLSLFLFSCQKKSHGQRNLAQ